MELAPKVCTCWILSKACSYLKATSLAASSASCKRRPGVSTDKAPDQVTEGIGAAIAANQHIDADRIRYVRSDQPGQFDETGWRWEILYRDEWRELPWHHDGPKYVTRALVRQWYG